MSLERPSHPLGIEEKRALIKPVGAGMYRWTGPPEYGRQDLGYTPGGAQDQFSFRTGNILLDNEIGEPALEMISPPREVHVLRDCCFTLTGGAVEAELHTPAETITVEHTTVYIAAAGSSLVLRRRRYGFRTYLTCRAAPSASRPEGEANRKPYRSSNWKQDGGINRQHPAGRSRGAYHDTVHWPDPAGRIRVIPGPEYSFLIDPQDFFRHRWTVSDELDEMGIRLTRGAGPPEIRREQLVSAPVGDGTIQMTPGGPIVLMRRRQTTGGYPRVAVVIGTDIDILAQVGPGTPLAFVPVTPAEALRARTQWIRDLESMRGRSP